SRRSPRRAARARPSPRAARRASGARVPPTPVLHERDGWPTARSMRPADDRKRDPMHVRGSLSLFAQVFNAREGARSPTYGRAWMPVTEGSVQVRCCRRGHRGAAETAPPEAAGTPRSGTRAPPTPPHRLAVDRVRDRAPCDQLLRGLAGDALAAASAGSLQP